MADSKISALTDGGNLQGTDQVAINRGGTTYRAVALQDGWIDDTAETWTYVSGSGGGLASFKITGVDVSAKYPVGTRIKLTQTTVKYFVVTAVAFSSDTTVTIMAGTDYTLANAAISANYHSYVSAPQGYPGWFVFATTTGGWSGTPTVSRARFNVIGRVCFIDMRITGTSTTGATTATAPIAMPTTVDGNGVVVGPVVSTDNGATVSTAGRALIASNSTTITFLKDFANVFTTSGTKTVGITGSYPI